MMKVVKREEGIIKHEEMNYIEFVDLLDDIQSNLDKVTTLLGTILDNYNLSNIEIYGEKGLISIIDSNCFTKSLSKEQKIAINWLFDSIKIYTLLEIINDYNFSISTKIEKALQ